MRKNKYVLIFKKKQWKDKFKNKKHTQKKMATRGGKKEQDKELRMKTRPL